MVLLSAVDAFSEFFRWYERWLSGWPDGKVVFLVRAALLLGGPIVIAGVVFQSGNRTLGFQVFAAMAGVLLAFMIPIEAAWFDAPRIRVVTVTLMVTALVFLPWVFAFVVARQRRTQRRVRYGAYAILVIGFLLS